MEQASQQKDAQIIKKARRQRRDVMWMRGSYRFPEAVARKKSAANLHVLSSADLPGAIGAYAIWLQVEFDLRGIRRIG
ncbi:MAG: hypothetical protein AB1813_05205 [Verrucomicrobiota bacterium]|jgi:hypothetical protein